MKVYSRYIFALYCYIYIYSTCTKHTNSTLYQTSAVLWVLMENHRLYKEDGHTLHEIISFWSLSWVSYGSSLRNWGTYSSNPMPCVILLLDPNWGPNIQMDIRRYLTTLQMSSWADKLTGKVEVIDEGAILIFILFSHDSLKYNFLWTRELQPNWFDLK